jgi:hypothetical protein
MNETENKSEGMSNSGKEDLRSDVQSLRTALNIALLFVFVIGFCVDVVLWNQDRLLGAQAREMQQAVNGFQSGAMQVWTSLNDYAKTHPDYAPIIQKYRPYISLRTNAPVAPAK